MSPSTAGLSRAEIARAVPAGSRQIKSQLEALRCGLACPDLANVRSDFREHLQCWWRIHVNHASWGGEGRPPPGTTEPTRARVCELSGMSVSTYKACRRWWADRGYVAIARPGWTPALRPAALVSPDDHNIRQAYVLCLPRKRCPAPPRSPARTLSRPLSQSRRDLDRFPAREGQTRKTGKADQTSRTDRPPVLRRGPLAALTGGWWIHITAPFAAWSATDLVWAVDHLPGGRQHRTRITNVRHAAGWLRWRLSHWLGADGTALPSPTQQRTEAALRHREYLAGRERHVPLAERAAALRLAYSYDHAAAADIPAAGPCSRTDTLTASAGGPGSSADGAGLARALFLVRDDATRDMLINGWLTRRGVSAGPPECTAQLDVPAAHGIRFRGPLHRRPYQVRPRCGTRGVFSQAEAIQGSALRSRVRKFESCWGRTADGNNHQVGRSFP
jgi:hypothetical protein